MGKSPDAFRTISEVADWLDTQAHVLRFWESKFTQVKPVKRAGGRRYYRPADMLLLGGIKKLLHDDGMTIKGAQKLLREKGIKYVATLSPPLVDDDTLAPEDEIDLAVVSAPVEEERGTVLSFERRNEAEALPPDADAPAQTAPEEPAPEETKVDDDAEIAAKTHADSKFLQDAEGDTFSFRPPPSAPEDESPEAPDSIPSFVQRVVPKPRAQDEVPASVTSAVDTSDATGATEEDITAPEPDETPPPAEDVTATEPTADPNADPDPELTLLSEIASMTAVAPQNRSDVAALLDRITALCDRIEAAENA
ncbi:MAG: MerR family transcriptional regulator [Rhodobacteraceae bacterium]|nr:MerR family transcriptional regulator [Paracoccaceae bacterium]